MGESAVTFSIIIPVFNTQAYIMRCMDSVLKQTFEAFEVICVDDGSTDGSGAILDTFEKQDHRVHIIHTQNHGIAEARNRGFKASCGRWIYFMDSDDWIEPDFLRHLEQYISVAGIQILMFDFYMHKKKKKVRNKSLPYNGDRILKNDSKTMLLPVYMKTTQAVWNKCFLREFLEVENIAFKNLYHADDVLFSIESYAKAGLLAYLNYPGYHYVKNPCSITRRFTVNQASMWVELYKEEMKLKQYFDEDMYVKYINSKLIDAATIIAYRYTFNRRNPNGTDKSLDEFRDMLKSAPFAQALHNYKWFYLNKSARLFMLTGRPSITIMRWLNFVRDRIKRQ